MNEEEYFEQLCSNSVDGTLTDSEKQKLEEHLAECPSCAAAERGSGADAQYAGGGRNRAAGRTA